MSAQTLLSVLDKVKPTGKGRWQACCPAHKDKSPSLSIREMEDGRVLVHCFAGCSVNEVVDAVGLDLDCLFPPKSLTNGPREKRPFAAADALRAIGFEALVVCAASAALATGAGLSPSDRERLLQAGERIQSALSGAGL